MIGLGRVFRGVVVRSMWHRIWRGPLSSMFGPNMGAALRSMLGYDIVRCSCGQLATRHDDGTLEPMPISAGEVCPTFQAINALRRARIPRAVAALARR